MNEKLMNIKMTLLATKCPEKRKQILTQKNRIKDEHKKTHITEIWSPKSKF